MHNRDTTILSTLIVALAVAQVVSAGTHSSRSSEVPPRDSAAVNREIFVPFEDLTVLLSTPPGRGEEPRHVLLSRQEYEDFLRKTKKEPYVAKPFTVTPVSAQYAISVGEGRAELKGRLVLEAAEEGLHAMDLDMAGVGLRLATLDGLSAPIGRSKEGKLTLFVDGPGEHELEVDLVARVETTAALQTLSFKAPIAPVTKMHLTVPGDVEIKRGADVIGRRFDEAAQETRFELVPKPGMMSLVMTLNNRLLQRRRVVVARSVVIDEITQAYERLHATYSMAILHCPVDGFRFDLPNGFEVTGVKTPLLSYWAVEGDGDERILQVQLRESTTETAVISLTAVSPISETRLQNWTLPSLKPLEAAGHVSVIGLLLDDRLKPASLQNAPSLLPIDTQVLTEALPEALLATPTQGGLRVSTGIGLRAVGAYYAPTETPMEGDSAVAPVSARFERPPARVLVTSNVLLVLGDQSHEVHGGFTLMPEAEKCFAARFSMPSAWHLERVTNASGRILPFEVTSAASTEASDDEDRDDGAVVLVRLPAGIDPGQGETIYFHAVHTPSGWLADWDTARAPFPRFAIADAVRDVGAIAIQGGEGRAVFPDVLEGLIPLDSRELAKYGPAGERANRMLSTPLVVFRYEAQPYAATFRVDRAKPRLTARSYSFLHFQPDLLSAHYEIAFDVEEARTDRLSFSLPASTPADVSIRALGRVAVKEYESEIIADRRLWKVLLTDRRQGTIRLACDFDQAIALLDPDAPSQDGKELTPPIVRAESVAYQSGVVAVQGDPELEIAITKHPRQVDVGELAGAESLVAAGPNVGGLGVFEYLGPDPELIAHVARYAGYELPHAVVQRAELVTIVSADGTSQTAARYHLRTKTSFLGIELPEGSDLWSAEVDGTPARPQRDRGRLLVSLPGQAGEELCELRIVYETPVDAFGFWSEVEIPAPNILLPINDSTQESVSVPLADMNWHLCLPSGFAMVDHEGTLIPVGMEVPEPAAWPFARFLYRLTGGVRRFGWWLPSLSRARELSSRARYEGAPYLYGGTDMDESVAQQAEAPAQALHAESTETKRGRRGTKKAMRKTPSAAPDTGPEEGKLGVAGTYWALEGVCSLNIQLEKTGQVAEFQSLGIAPRLNVSLVNSRRIGFLGWGLALLVAVAGLTRRHIRSKARFVVIIAVAATVIPLIFGSPALVLVMNPVFYAAVSLVPIYLALATSRWILAKVRRPIRLPAAAAAALMFLAVTVAVAEAQAPTPKGDEANPVFVRLTETTEPIEFPQDAVIVPYDPRESGLEPPSLDETEKVLVPYSRFRELWALAYGDEDGESSKPRTGFALAGSAFEATLDSAISSSQSERMRAQGEEHVEVLGHIMIDVFADSTVAVPLVLSGGVLAGAELDGVPAPLGLEQPGCRPHVLPESSWPPNTDHTAGEAAQGAASPPGARDEDLIYLYVEGKGRHRLDLNMRMKVVRRGGWRVVEGRLPAAAASALTIRVPRADTEITFGHTPDRRTYEIREPGEVIRTALGAEGRLSLKWRPRVRTGEVDPSLTVASEVLLDVREDGLRCIWKMDFQFGQTEHDSFTIHVPSDYQVQKVIGTNVRGWTVVDEEPTAGPDAQQQRLNVMLLKPAKESEQFTIIMHRPLLILEAADVERARSDRVKFEAPVVRVEGAQLQSGQLNIRHSSHLIVWTGPTRGLTRIDTTPGAARLAALDGEGWESPLGIQAYQAYKFAATPFVIELTSLVPKREARAEVQSLLRIAERIRSLESRIQIGRASSHLIHQVRLALPGDFDVEHVSAPEPFEWSLTEKDDRRLMTVLLPRGQDAEFGILIRGRLGKEEVVDSVPLPRIEVLDVKRQTGDIVVQVDPAFEVKKKDFRDCHETQLGLIRWLKADQRRLATMAVHYDSPGYSGDLRLTPRTPLVKCSTITNVRVTETALEETILLNFHITGAGIRSVSFLLPFWTSDARITVPMLRQKTVEPTASRPEAPVRVRLDLQDEVMGHLRVLVENDRLLTPESHSLPIPIVETGQTRQQYATLESAGRDEVLVEKLEGMEPLGKNQKEWQSLVDMLGSAVTEAYVVNADEPVLAFKTKQRQTVRTAGARIGLAQANLVVDSNGAYRAAQSYRIENSTEQWLEVQLPEGAELWGVHVATRPVKPAQAPGAQNIRNVRIPLVKTAPGDLDYEVLVKYGGELPAPGNIASLDFPLIRTVNVPVELSQVRLFLPEEYHWLDFGGTMRKVNREQELAAGYVRYQTRQAERLAATMRDEDPFGRVRAAESFETLKSQMAGFAESTQFRRRGAALEQEIDFGQVAIQKAEQQRKQVVQVPQQPREGSDNRSVFVELYKGQQTSRARNVVQDLESNFYAADIEQQRGRSQAPSGFESQWLASNSLASVEGFEEKLDEDEADEALRGSIIDGSAGQRGADQREMPEEAQRQLAGLLDRTAQTPQAKPASEAEPPRRGGRRGKGEILEKYQQQLSQEAGRGAVDRGEIELGEESSGEVYADLLVDSDRFYATSMASPRKHAGPRGAGLASLSVDLPVRGAAYLFTTPRGDVAITARAVSRSFAKSAERIGLVLLVVLICVVLYRLKRRGWFGPLAGRTGATILILLGILAAVAGVLPGVGLIAIITGVTLRIRARHKEQMRLTA